MQVCGYSHKYLEGSSIAYSFYKTSVVNSAIGHGTSLDVGYWPGLVCTTKHVFPHFLCTGFSVLFYQLIFHLLVVDFYITSAFLSPLKFESLGGRLHFVLVFLELTVELIHISAKGDIPLQYHIY